MVNGYVLGFFFFPSLIILVRQSTVKVLQDLQGQKSQAYTFIIEYLCIVSHFESKTFHCQRVASVSGISQSISSVLTQLPLV